MNRRVPKKLLVASLGVAAVSYVACGSDDKTSQFPGGGDAATPADATAPDQLIGNLMPNPDARVVEDQLVANLVAPPEDASLKD